MFCNPDAQGQLADGSGLSIADLVAPDDVTALLDTVQDEPWFDAPRLTAIEPTPVVPGSLGSFSD